MYCLNFRTPHHALSTLSAIFSHSRLDTLPHPRYNIRKAKSYRKTDHERRLFMPRKKYSCFVVCAIGEPGSEIREDADDLLELIIKPALEIYDFDVLRGDHRSEANQIDIDVIKSVQDADLCIIDISRPNPNVYYELGRRDETGKDRILLRSRSAGDMPVDIATQRYIQYDFNDRHSIRDAVKQIRNFVEPMIDRGFESSTGASLADIAAALSRLERKMDRISGGSASAGSATPTVVAPPPVDGDPREVFTLAARQRNLPLLERALDQLALSMDKLSFLDYYVEVAAGRGLIKAGQMLIDNAVEFMDSPMSFRKKIEYLGSLVGFLTRNDRELEQLDLVEKLCSSLWALREGAAPKDIAQIFNQRNRLYHGIYGLTDDPQWLRKAIHELEQAKEYAGDESYIYFNLAMIYRAAGELQNAKTNVLRAIEIDADKPDADHLEIACKILRKLDDPDYPAMLERLRAVSPVKAALIESAKS